VVADGRFRGGVPAVEEGMKKREDQDILRK
jgi:hypothetical protein